MAETYLKHPPGAVKALLYSLGVVGMMGTWGRSAADGTLGHAFKALHGGEDAPYILPGTEFALKTKFTGVYWPVDYLLDVSVIFFWEAVDGSHPAASAVGLYFLGQYFPVLVCFYVTYQRAGHGRSVLKPTLWALAFQFGAVGGVNWAWAISFLASSPTMSRTVSRDALKRASLAEPRSVYLAFSALLVGFCVPAVVMGLPSPLIVSNNFQQWALVTWNMWALLVLLMFKAFAAMDSAVDNRQPAWRSDKHGDRSSDQKHLRSVRTIYTMSLAFGFTMHIGIVTISLAVALFPSIFDSAYRQEFSILSLFVPPISFELGSTVGDGVRSFLLWDQVSAYFVVLLVALLQLKSASRTTGVKFSWLKAIAATVIVSCVMGPGSTCVMISWLYDELLFGVGK